MREAFESIYRVTHGSTVLLDYGDWLLEDPEIQPAKDVQRSQFAGGLAARTWDRGNKMHTLSFSRWRLHDSTWQAAAARLETIAAWPDGAEAVTVEVQCHSGSLTLYKATVAGLRCQAHDRLTLAQYDIEGGALSGALVFTALPDELEPLPTVSPITDQDGDPLTDQSGDDIHDQT